MTRNGEIIATVLLAVSAFASAALLALAFYGEVRTAEMIAQIAALKANIYKEGGEW